MIDGIATGYQHAVWLLGYLLGVAPVLFLAANLILLAVVIGVRITHRVRVHRVRAQTRRSGRLKP